MVAIGFTAFDKNWMFKSIREGIKDQTIRIPRKNPIKPLSKLQLYWRMRTKDCVKIADAVCTEYFKVYINYSKKEVLVLEDEGFKCLTNKEFFEFLIRDGFVNAEDFWEYFKEGGEYVAIRWRLSI